jgi:hypothetical protein
MFLLVCIINRHLTWRRKSIWTLERLWQLRNRCDWASRCLRMKGLSVTVISPLTGSLLDRNDCSYPAFLFIWLFESLFPRKTLWLPSRYFQYTFMAPRNKISHFNTFIPFYFISINIHNLLFSYRFISCSYRFALTFIALL